MNTVAFLSPVQAQLQLVEARLHAQADERHPDLRAALEQILAAGGKRIRPTLGLLIGDMLGAPEDRLVTLGAAVELLHTATLVHDDLIDGSLLRRGTPTLNARWSPAATVLTGDFLFARAAKLAAETGDLPLMELFAETLAVIVSGELTQMFSSRGVVDRPGYYTRIYAKTASLFEMTCRAAAMISPANSSVVESMRVFGYETGMAFQIVDDILDFTGEQAAMGKPIGSDLLSGLVTLPAIYYAEVAPQDQDILALSEGGWANQEKMGRLVESIRRTNAVQLAMQEAARHVDRAVEVLQGFEFEHRTRRPGELGPLHRRSQALVAQPARSAAVAPCYPGRHPTCIHTMTNTRNPLRINVGFILHEEAGYSHDFDFDFPEINAGPGLGGAPARGPPRYRPDRAGIALHR